MAESETKSVKFAATVFWQPDGSIRLTTNDIRCKLGVAGGTIIIVDADRSNKNGHPKLHEKLAEILTLSGRNSPEKS